MRKKIAHNIGLKIISALFAIVLWLIVVNIIDPVETKTFTNIQVTVENESAIKSQGKVYDIIENSDSINVTVKGRRSALESLKNSDFRAVADMREMIVANTVPIEVSVTKYNDMIEEIIPRTKTLKISIEDSASKQFPINVITKGNAGEGYAVGEATCNPSVLKVTGAASVVNKISRVAVEVDLGDMTTTINDYKSPIFYNSDGDIIESTSLEYMSGNVAVTVTFLKTKEIPLEFTAKGTPNSDYRCTDVVSAPDTITIAGTASALSKVSKLELPDDAIDITGATENVQQLINISEHLPEGIKLVDSSDENVLITAVIEQLKTRNIEIPLDSISFNGLSDSYSAEFASDDKVLIAVKGLSDDISKVEIKDIKANIDLSGVRDTGTKAFKLNIELPDSLDVELVNDVNVNIQISRKATTSRQ